jgi:DNA (cytosine-5)-methyltransferase 1
MKYEESEKQRSFCYSNNETAKVNHHPTGKPTVLELFAGVGGMSLGLEKAGFDVKWVVDSDELAAATLTANKTNSVNVYTEKLSKFLKSCLQEDPAYPKPGEVDHIHASPPCKGFSRANRNGGRDDTVNNKVSLSDAPVSLWDPSASILTILCKSSKHFYPSRPFNTSNQRP